MAKKKKKAASKIDDRFDHMKMLIEAGAIKEFNDIFKYVRKTPLATALKIHLSKFTIKMHNPMRFELDEIKKMADVFDVPFKKMLDLILKEMQ